MDSQREQARLHAQLAHEIWHEFAAILQKQLPDLNDLLVLAATKVAKDHFNPKNRNMEIATMAGTMSVLSDDTHIIIKITK